MILCLFLSVLWIAACSPTPPVNQSGLEAITVVPTLDTSNAESLCEAVDNAWERDWPTVIRTLLALETLQASCDDQPVQQQIYAAYSGYGVLLEQSNRRDEAIEAYQTALQYNATGLEALDALSRLHVSASSPPAPCDLAEMTVAQTAVPNYSPSTGSFIRIEGSTVVLDDELFPIYGVNYYPRDTPWKHFLSETDPASVEAELDLLSGAGINTLRVFLWHEALFHCPGAVPVADAFARLDTIIQAAVARDLRLIVTLNDLPDLSAFPLYDSPRHADEQIVYIVRRYHDEPAILAWDLRNGGDLDYLDGSFEKTDVLEWLTRTAILVRRADPNHIITASWQEDPEATIPAVDVVSAQHFGEVAALRQRLAVLRETTDKPILLSAVGYSSYEMDEISQRNALQQALEAAENNGLAGWVVWTAFDYPLTATCLEPDCLSADSADHHFGLWNTSYFPKLTVDVIELMTS